MFITWKKKIEERLERLESEFLCTKGLHAWVTDGSSYNPRIKCVFCKKYYEPEKPKTDA